MYFYKNIYYMILSTFVTFNTEEKERIDRLIDDLDLEIFFETIIYQPQETTFNNDERFCLIGFSDIISQIYPELDILVCEITNKIQWIFSYTEDKNFYQKTIINYIQESLYNHISKFNYKIVDYFFLDKLEDNTVRELIKYIIDNNDDYKIEKSLIIDKSIYFILQKNPLIIYNISLKMIKYYNGSQGVQDIIDYFVNNSISCIQDINRESFNKIREVIDNQWLDNVILERNLINLI